MKHAMKAAAVALCLAVAPATADTARVEIRANVAGVCNMGAVSVTEVTFNPLHLNAMVNPNCNATHSLTVTYSPPSPTNPVSLQMTYGGQAPSAAAPGTVTFGNLPVSNAPKLLVIKYSGPPSDRTSIKNSVAIQVSLN